MQWAADHATVEWNPDRPIRMVNIFGRASSARSSGGKATPLDTLCVARSSDSSLPLPHVVGPDTFEAVIADLRQDSSFARPGFPMRTCRSSSGPHTA